MPAERTQTFGAALEIDKRYNVVTASVFKTKLLEYNCSDDPWE
jgi:hypothetical protein